MYTKYKQTLDDHYEREHLQLSYSCTICDFVTKRKRKLQEHKERHGKVLQCKIVSKVLQCKIVRKYFFLLKGIFRGLAPICAQSPVYKTYHTLF